MKSFKNYLEESKYGMLKHQEETAPQRHHEAMLDHHIQMSNHYFDKTMPIHRLPGDNRPTTRPGTDHYEKMSDKHARAAEHHNEALNTLGSHGKDHPKYHAHRDKANAASKKLGIKWQNK